MSVLISVAMKEESLLLYQALTGRKRLALSQCERFKCAGKWCYLLTTGVGKVNAAVNVTKYLYRYQSIDTVINIGFAAATKDLELGKVYKADIISQWDFNISDNIARHDRFNLHTGGNIHLTSGDSFVTKHNIKQVHIMEPYARMFDMEAYAVAKACENFPVDLFVLKVVSDHPEDNDDDSSFKNYIAEARCNLFESVLSLIESL